MTRSWISALQRLKASGTASEGSVATRHCEECELQHTTRIRRKPPSGHTHVSVWKRVDSFIFLTADTLMIFLSW